METYSIYVSDSFQKDLMQIIYYINHSFSAPFTAANFLEIIENTLYDLSLMPQRYVLVSDTYLRKKGFRKCLIKKYILFFTIDEDSKSIHVHRILHSRQNWMNIL